MTGCARIIRGNALALPLADASVDLICTSPPYFGLRSYTDDGQHYAGQLGSEPTPAEFVDALIAATREMVRVLKPSGSIFVNLGDKYCHAGRTRPKGNAEVVPWRAQGGVIGARGGKGQNDTVMHIGPEDSGVPVKSLMGIPWRYALRCIDDLGLILRAEVIWAKPNGLPESVTDRVRRSHESWFHFTREPRYFSAVDEIREEHAGTSWATAKRLREGAEQQGPRAADRRAANNASVKGDALNPLGKLPGSVWTINEGESLLRSILTAVSAGDISVDEGEELLWTITGGDDGDVERSHESWFHFTREPRYFSAVDEIREEHSPNSIRTRTDYTPLQRAKEVMPGRAGEDPQTARPLNPLGKLPGSVWSIPTQPLTVPPELGVDHFAAFPMEWPRRIIQGWSPAGVCTDCGEGRRPVQGIDWGKVPHETVEKRALTDTETADWCAGFADWCAASGVSRQALDEAAGTSDMGGWWASRLPHRAQVPTPEQWAKIRAAFDPPDRFDPLVNLTRSVPVALFKVAVVPGAMRHRNKEPATRPDGYRSITGYACGCPEPTAPTRPAVILDPFGGTGTTALVAKALGRAGISVDMSADYCRLAEWRCNDSGQMAAALQVERPEPVSPDQLDLFSEVPV